MLQLLEFRKVIDLHIPSDWKLMLLDYYNLVLSFWNNLQELLEDIYKLNIKYTNQISL